jgi:hypothetical protein
MTSNVDVQDTAPGVLDHEQTIQLSEHHCRNSKEFQRDDHFAVVLQERQPTSSGVAAAGHTPEVARNASLGDLEAQLQQLTMNPRCSLTGILAAELTNQLADFIINLGLPVWRPDRHRQ